MILSCLEAIWLSLGFELDDIAKLTAYGITSTNADDIEAALRKYQAAGKKSQQSQANVQQSSSTRPNSRPEPVIQSPASGGRRSLNIQPPKTAAAISKEKRVNQMLKSEEIWRAEALSLAQTYMWDNFKETKAIDAGFENFRRFEVVHFGFFHTRGLSEEDVQVEYITNNPDMATTVEGWKEEARILRDTVKWDIFRDTRAKDMEYADYSDLANVEYGMYEEDIKWFQDRLKYATPQFHRIEKVPAGSLGMGLPTQDGWAAEI